MYSLLGVELQPGMFHSLAYFGDLNLHLAQYIRAIGREREVIRVT
jgi:hypothetical protein